MATRNNDTPMSNQAGRVPAARNPLAGLDQRTTTAAATAPTGDGLKTGQSVNFSGQYLFDRFIVADREDQTKLGIVRQAVEQVDTASWKAALAEMVRLAKEDSPTKYMTAKTVQSQMRAIYGALKNVPDELEQAGMTNDTGYAEAYNIGRTVLSQKGLKWDGTTAESKEDREARLANKEALKVKADLERLNPMQAGETMSAWSNRIVEMMDDAMEQHDEDTRQARITAATEQFMTQFGDLAIDVASKVIDLYSDENAMAEWNNRKSREAEAKAKKAQERAEAAAAMVAKAQAKAQEMADRAKKIAERATQQAQVMKSQVPTVH